MFRLLPQLLDCFNIKNAAKVSSVDKQNLNTLPLPVYEKTEFAYRLRYAFAVLAHRKAKKRAVYIRRTVCSTELEEIMHISS
jgi:hypothetical protein